MPPTIAENLRRVMEAKGVDAIELSRRLRYQGRAMVDHWLAGRRALSKESLSRVAAALEVTVQEIDPAEIAYTPAQRKARSAEKRANGRHEFPSHSHVAAPPPNPTGVDMGPGDQALFAQVEGAWKLLRNDEERRAFVEHVRGFVHQTTAPEAARKKATR
jgi:transcriptional regulator with XRE-family HTH domain